ncbi:MAG: amidohydrolase family protein [Pseudomonadota bacterium]
MRVAIVELATIVTGDHADPFAKGDALLVEDGRITALGTLDAAAVETADLVIDAAGATAAPGLIDSHVHITFGDYTPRQQTVGFLASYLHGGTTTAITASEVHVPGRPSDVEGVKALAVAAQRCFEHYRPGGMRVHAGSVILEPGLTRADFDELRAKGVWLAKAGFGAVESPLDYVPLVKDAQAAGLLVTVHTGGASIPGSAPVTGSDLLAMNPEVAFHVNGGPVAMADADYFRVVKESRIALQICQAGNLRTALLCTRLAMAHGALDRLLIATDTPTGTGVMPLGMLYTITQLSSLGDLEPERALAAATGSVARVYGLETGFLRVGAPADLLLLDAPLGGSQTTALAAIRNGDIPALGAVLTDGIPRFVGRSRNTPPCTRPIRLATNRLPREFEG